MDWELLDAGEGMARGVPYAFALSSNGANSCSYEWWLGNFFNSQAPYLETEDFLIGHYKWRLRLFPKVTAFGVNYISVHLVSLNRMTVTVELRITAINRKNPQNSQVAGDVFKFKMNEDRGFPCFQDLSTVMDPDAGFFRDGRYVLEAALSVIPGAEQEEEPLFEASQAACASRMDDPGAFIDAIVFTNDDIEQEDAPMHPFGLPYTIENTHYAFQMDCRVEELIKRVYDDQEWNEESGRLWLCNRKSDGSLRLHTPLNADPSSNALQIRHLCDAPQDGGAPQLLLYLEEPNKDEEYLLPLNGDTWIVFVKQFDPSNGSLSYYGTIRMHKASLCSSLKDRVKNLLNLEDEDCDIFMQENDLVPRLIDTDEPLTIEERGIQDKSVLIICKKENGESFSAGLECALQQSMYAMLADNQGSGSEQLHQPQTTQPNDVSLSEILPESEAHQSMNTRTPVEDEEDEDLCVICLVNKRTSGFLHQDQGAHLCACQDCADEIMKGDNPRCPLCMQDIIHVIKSYH